jgi:hypothetical protein
MRRGRDARFQREDSRSLQPPIPAIGCNSPEKTDLDDR